MRKALNGLTPWMGRAVGAMICVAGFMGLEIQAAYASCGDNVVEQNEQCDDGNIIPGDGCDASCNTEQGFVCNAQLLCGNSVVDFGEQCDDGNLIEGDGCDSCSVEIDMTNFIREPYSQLAPTLGTPLWNVQPGGRSVSLPTSVNPKPGLFISDDALFSAGSTRRLRFEFDGSNDDDYVGFAFGLNPGDATNPAADYMLLAWKEAAQAPLKFRGSPLDDACAADGNVNATTGLSLVRVQGIPNADELWARGTYDCANTAGSVTNIATSTNYGSEGYAPAYPDIQVIYSSTRIQVYIDNVLDIDVAGSFPGAGRYGLYTFAQQGVTFNILGSNNNSNTACSPVCGDSIIVAGEQCDDGDTDSGDGCDGLCGVEPGYTCNGAPSVCASVCGDGTTSSDEACDDSNLVGGDGCDGLCEIEPGFSCSGSPSVCAATCSNGQFDAGEQCDDSNLVDGDGCDSTCNIETGFTCIGFPSACATTCGDSIIAGMEACDDGDADDNDGCSSVCQIEPGFVCDGAPSVCSSCGDGLVEGAETCDDSNTASADGCSMTCQTEADYTCPTEGGTCLTVTVSAPAQGVTLNMDPTFSGSATPLASVTVTLTGINGVVTSQTVMTDMNGLWTLAPQNLPDGAYTVEASVTTSGGTISDSNTFVLDTQTTLSVDSPFGVISDDTPTISGTGEPGAMVSVTLTGVNGGALGVLMATVGADGTWSLMSPALADDVYTITAESVDGQGNMATAMGGFTVDTTSPTLVVTGPMGLITDNTPTLEGTVDDDVATVSVTLTDDQGMMYGPFSAPVSNGAWSVDATQLPDGDYTLSAQATDAAGNSTTQTDSFSLDATAPVVSVDSPTATVNSNTPVISGSVSADATSVEVTLTDAQGQVQGPFVATVTNGMWTLSSPMLADGAYTIDVEALDAAGNDGDAAGAFVVDTEATVSLTTPANGSSIATDSPSIEGTVEPGSTVVVTLVGPASNPMTTTFNATVQPNGSWSVDTTGLAEGNYTVTADATDAVGNTAQDAGGFEVDVTAPTVSVTSPADGSITSDVRPVFSGTSDANTSVEVVLVDAQGDEVYRETVTSDASGNWTASSLPADLVDASYVVRAQATDDAGNTSAQSLNAFEVNTSALALSIDSPAPGTTLDTRMVDISGTTEPNTTVTVTVFNDLGVPVVGPVMVTSDAAGDWSLPETVSSDGAYTVDATVLSLGGITTSAASNFSVDTVAPTLTLDAPADNSFTSDSTPAIAGTSEEGVVLEVVIRDANGDVVETLTPVVDATGGWSIDASSLVDGPYSVDVTATDDAGNTTTVGPNAFTVDTQTPTLSIDEPLDMAVLSTTDAVVSGQSDANQEVVVVIVDAQGNEVARETVTTDAQGGWSVMVPNLTNGESYKATATATDAAQNESIVDTNFSIDTEDPVVTIDAPATGTSTTNVRPAINGSADTDATLVVTVRDANGVIVFGPEAVMTDAAGVWSVDLLDDLAEGSYVVEAVATSPNGRMATVTSAFDVDLTSPTVTITAPAPGAVIADTTPTITGTTEPNAQVTVTLTGDNGEVFTQTVTADAQGVWTLDAPDALDDGDYTIGAVAIDAAGNEGDETTSTFTLDTTAPMVTITAPAVDQQIADTTPTITGTAPAGSTVTVTVDGTVVGTAVAGADGVWILELGDELTVGAHTVEATSTSASGAEGSSGEVAFVVTQPEVTLTIDSPTQGEDALGEPLVVTGKGTPGSEVVVTAGGVTQTVVVNADGTWTASLDDVPTGNDVVITVTSGDQTASVTINVVTGMILLGGGCSSTGQPAGGSLWGLLALLGIGMWRRRRVC